MINPNQRQAYYQALETWKSAAHDAQRVKDHVYGMQDTADNMYLITDQDLNYLQKECEAFQRLANIARQL